MNAFMYMVQNFFRKKKVQAFLVAKSYTDYKFSELLFVGAIMFFRNAPGRFYFAFLHSFTSFLGINNSYAYKYYWITFNFISFLLSQSFLVTGTLTIPSMKYSLNISVYASINCKSYNVLSIVAFSLRCGIDLSLSINHIKTLSTLGFGL